MDTLCTILPATLLLIACLLGSAGAALAGEGATLGPRLLGRWEGTGALLAETTAVAVEFRRAGGDSIEGRIWMSPLNVYGMVMGTLRGDATHAMAPATGMTFALTPGDSLVGSVFGPALLVRLARSPAGSHAFDGPAPLPDTTSPGAAALLPHAAWRYAARGPLWASPVVADGTVYVGDQSGRVHAVSLADGHARWTFDAGGAVFGDAAVVGDAVYVVADPGVLYRLDRTSGAVRWKVPLGPPAGPRSMPGLGASDWDDIGPAPLVLDGTIYVGAADSVFRALDAATGRTRWQFATHGAIRGTACADAKRVYVGSLDHFVYALDRATGREAWRFDAKSPITHGPMVAGGRVVVGIRDYSLLWSIDAETGQRQWRRTFWGSWVESTAGLVDGTLYIGASDGQRVRAIDPATGRYRWEAWVGGWTPGTPLVIGNTVYYATGGGDGYFIPEQGSLGALDRATGRILWRIPVANSPERWPAGYMNSVVRGGKDLVITAGLDGALTAWRPATRAR